MSLYLKALGYNVYLATINNAYCLNGKNLKANAKALYALKSTLNDDYLSRVANLDLAFVVWNTLLSLGENDHTMRGVTRMLEATSPTCATWSKGITPLR